MRLLRSASATERAHTLYALKGLTYVEFAFEFHTIGLKYLALQEFGQFVDFNAVFLTVFVDYDVDAVEFTVGVALQNGLVIA